MAGCNRNHGFVASQDNRNEHRTMSCWVLRNFILFLGHQKKDAKTKKKGMDVLLLPKPNLLTWNFYIPDFHFCLKSILEQHRRDGCSQDSLSCLWWLHVDHKTRHHNWMSSIGEWYPQGPHRCYIIVKNFARQRRLMALSWLRCIDLCY